MTTITDVVGMSCPAWCESANTDRPGHQHHSEMIDVEVHSGPNGDGRLHWFHEGPRLSHRGVYVGADTFPNAPAEFFANVDDLSAAPITDPAELRAIGQSLLDAADWIEANR